MPPKRATSRSKSATSRADLQEAPSAEAQLIPCGGCGNQIIDQGVQCEGICRWWFHHDCLQTDEQRLDASSYSPWKCDKCHAMSSAITEMTDMARDLSARVRSLEALNRELEAVLVVNHPRLRLSLESQEQKRKRKWKRSSFRPRTQMTAYKSEM